VTGCAAAHLLTCRAVACAGMTQQNEQLRMQVAALLQETQYKVRPAANLCLLPVHRCPSSKQTGRSWLREPTLHLQPRKG